MYGIGKYISCHTTPNVDVVELSGLGTQTGGEIAQA